MVLTTALILLVLAVIAALIFGGPKPIAPLASINKPFDKVDFSDVPNTRSFAARDGTRLARLAYSAAGAAPGTRRIVLVHGSSARARSMHVLAKSLAHAGLDVASLDMRGHGDSGPRGQVRYVDQLGDDVEDFLRAVPHTGPSTLAGFSSGGGFVLRFAGGKRQDLFDRYLLLAPYLHRTAPINRVIEDKWVSVGLPRFIALSLLNRIGITAWNHLPVLRFGLDDSIKDYLTSSYSYTLTRAFGPHDNYRGDISRSRVPMRIMAGSEDELFDASRYASTFADAGRQIPVTVVPGVSHMGLTLDSRAMSAIINAAGKQRCAAARRRAKATASRAPIDFENEPSAMNTPLSNDEIDRLARRRAGAKLGWYAHAVVYLVINLLLFALSEYGTGLRRWSIFPMVGWGLGLVLHGVAVFLLGSGSGLRERMVEKERERLRRDRGQS